MYRAYVTICWSAKACSRHNVVTELHCASFLDLCHRHNASHQSQYSLQLLRTSDDKPLHGQPLWERSDLDPGQLINEFQRECHVVRRSIDGDLVKASSRRAYLACSTHHCDSPRVSTRGQCLGIRPIQMLRAYIMLICQAASALSVMSLAKCMQCLNPCRQACMPAASAHKTYC